MEIIRGRKIKDILLHNGNWWNFFLCFTHLIREDIITNIIKIMACGSAFLGYHVYECPECPFVKTVFHTCKSRFCASCGKKATDNWINKHLKILPQTVWQHVTFTFPKELQSIFWLNRHLLNKMAPIPAGILTECAAKMGVIPGIFAAIHTFGRDLKRNLHFHLSVTLSGLSTKKTVWMQGFKYNKQSLIIIKRQWKERIIALLRQVCISGNLVLPSNTNEATFLAYLDDEVNKSWVVHFSKPSKNHYRTVKYLGRYLKRPPIGETRIKDYDGKNVTYTYYDHHKKKTHIMTLPVFDFIKRLITHVPDKYCRLVRYYNWLSNRTRNEYLPFIYKSLKQIVEKVVVLSWRELYRKTFGVDPLKCPCCKKATLELITLVFTHSISILRHRHQDVANLKNYCLA